MTSARAHLVSRIAARARRFPDLEPERLEPGDLSARDAALASAIDNVIAKRWLTLEALLRHCIDRPWENVEPRQRAVLLIGAAQIVFLDRVPVHAAIDDAVNLARRAVRPRAASFTNAVLRRVAGLIAGIEEATDDGARDTIPSGDGRLIRLTDPVFAEEPVRRESERTSHGPELVRQWLDVFGELEMKRLLAHDLVQPPIVISGIDPAEAREDEFLAPHEQPGFHVWSGARGTLEDLLSARPGARVQDAATARPVAATACVTAEVIVDVCAGRGTKTRQLADLHPNATVVATDINPARLEDLLTIPTDHANVTVIPFTELSEYLGRTDLLVLDVPCTNTAVLARRPEAKYRFSRKTLTGLVDRQRQIIADTLSLLQPEGHLLYCTCSLDPSENEQQIDWIEHWHPFVRVRTEWTLPTGGPSDPPTAYADGGGFGLIRRGR